MSRFFSYPPYVPVAERRRRGEKAARKLAGKGRTLAPITLESKTIAKTFWGKAWCDNLESYSDYENRLPRGRSYIRNGSVLDLQLSAGKIQALVAGSSLYKIVIEIAPLPPKRWKAFTGASAGKVANLLDLLQGRLSKDILTEITAHKSGLFPAPKDIKLSCSCPDWAVMCKHVAAALYGVGARLDTQPDLFFTLRGVEMHDLIRAAGKGATEVTAAGTTRNALDGADLSEIFGVEIEMAEMPVSAAKRTTTRTKNKAIKKKSAVGKGKAVAGKTGKKVVTGENYLSAGLRKKIKPITVK